MTRRIALPRNLLFLAVAALAGAAHAGDAVPLPVTPAVGEPVLPYSRFIVTYRSDSAERRQPTVAAQGVRRALATTFPTDRAAATGEITQLRTLATGAALIRVPRTLSAIQANSLMRQIATDPAVLRVEADRLMHPIADIAVARTMGAADFTADDPYFVRYQWHLRPGDGHAETIGRDTSAYANFGGSDVSRAWNLADGAGITVAVIDTGLTHHPDIDLSLGDAGYDFITDAYVSGRPTNDRTPGGWDLGDWTSDATYTDPQTGCAMPATAEDSSWHGTHVAGTIAELTANATGMAGTAHAARVLPIRALGHCGGYNSDIADAIVWAAGGHIDGVSDNTHPAQVISMSLGGQGTCYADDITGLAIAQARALGAVVVVAAGNSGAESGGFTPASCPGVISVAAVGITGKRAYYSNYGNLVAIAAPGGGIFDNDSSSGVAPVDAGFVWSTINTGPHEPDPAGYAYGGMAGTSQATPHVAGTVALMLGAARVAGRPVPNADTVLSMLRSSARGFPTAPLKPIGAGIVDAYAAVAAAAGIDLPPDTTMLTRGVTLGNQSAPGGGSKVYTIVVPAGAKALNLRTSGGTGNATLYVRAGQAPKADGSDATYVSSHAGNAEAVVIPTPAATTYFLRATALDAYSGLSVLATYVGP
jgi:serine protease